MKAHPTLEKKTLTELRRMFADPISAERRHARHWKVALAAAFVCAVMAGALKGGGLRGDASAFLLVMAGICIGVTLHLRNASKQVSILTRYCSLDVASVERRLAEYR